MLRYKCIGCMQNFGVQPADKDLRLCSLMFFVGLDVEYVLVQRWFSCGTFLNVVFLFVPQNRYVG